MTYQVAPITVSTLVPASTEAVLKFVADTRNDPLWCQNVETVEMLTPEPVAVGSKFRFHQHLDRPGGERLQFDVDVEIIALDDREVRWLVTDRFQERDIRISVEPAGEGCRVAQTTRATFRENPGLARWVYPRLAKRIFKRQFEALANRFATRTD